jgi:DivIVA domain-containing protein
MGQVLLLLVVALTVAAVVFGVTVLVTGSDPGLADVEPDGRAVPLPGNRPLQESDLSGVRFDTALRGYRMAQVDQALRRTAYDIGYKDELINVLLAEVEALRAGRVEEADGLRRAREAALVGSVVATGGGAAPGGAAAGVPDSGPSAGPTGASGGDAAGSVEPAADGNPAGPARSGSAGATADSGDSAAEPPERP